MTRKSAVTRRSVLRGATSLGAAALAWLFGSLMQNVFGISV